MNTPTDFTTRAAKRQRQFVIQRIAQALAAKYRNDELELERLVTDDARNDALSMMGLDRYAEFYAIERRLIEIVGMEEK